jgi:hypothetical protein
MTFEVLADNFIGKVNYQPTFEVAGRCRGCFRISLFLLAVQQSMLSFTTFDASNKVSSYSGDLSRIMELVRVIGLADLKAKPTPSDLPTDIDLAFQEGARSLAARCPNAASAMFRLCLDLATAKLLPEPGTEGGPTDKERRDLAPRLRFLFRTGRLPEDLRELSTAVKANGDEGVHAGALTAEDAEDIYDFAYELLRRLYTDPARLAEAKRRRDERKAKGNPA